MKCPKEKGDRNAIGQKGNGWQWKWVLLLPRHHVAVVFLWWFRRIEPETKLEIKLIIVYISNGKSEFSNSC